jgi:hypothetical protein
MKPDALNDLAPPPPGFGRNRISIEELLFVGNTYVYRGEYPRKGAGPSRGFTAKSQAVERETTLSREQRQEIGRRAAATRAEKGSERGGRHILI